MGQNDSPLLSKEIMSSVRDRCDKLRNMGLFVVVVGIVLGSCA